MQICMTYVFSQETFVRGTKTRFFYFMDLKEWSKDTVMYSQQVGIIKERYKTSYNSYHHTAKGLCKLVLSYSFSMSFFSLAT